MSEETIKNSLAFVETVIDRIGDQVVSSTVRPATENDIITAKELHILSKCSHNVIFDEQCWPYDSRTCFTCGKWLGNV